MDPLDVVIVGGACAGLSAAIYVARAQRAHVVFEGNPTPVKVGSAKDKDSKGGDSGESMAPYGGQLSQTSLVENYSGAPAIGGYDLVDAMRTQAKEQGAVIRQETVTSMEYDGKLFHLVAHDGETETKYTSRSVIFATGAVARWGNVENEFEFRGRGVSTCAVCEGALPRFRNKNVVVVGGGDGAMEEALWLAKYASRVFIVHRSQSFRASSVMLRRAQESPKITFVTDATVERVEGNETQGLTTVFLSVLAPPGSLRKVYIPASGLFYAIGHDPATALIRNSRTLSKRVALDAERYVQWKPSEELGTTATSLPGFFAAGDVADKRYRQAITAAGTGAAASLDVERWLSASA